MFETPARPTPNPPAAFSAANHRRCVYTVLTGRYETLNEQPATRDSSIPFICFTDDPALTSETWQVRKLTPAFPDDPVRSQRECKLRPHRHLPEFDASLYIDNSVILCAEPEHVFDTEDIGAGLSLPEHSFHATLLDEFAAIATLRLDDPGRVLRQLECHCAETPSLLRERPFWAGILLRDHRNPTVRAAMERWFELVQAHSRRDQLSCAAALRAAGLTPARMPIDNHQSWFHSWPHTLARKTARRTWPAPRPGAEAAVADALAARIAGLRSAARVTG